MRVGPDQIGTRGWLLVATTGVVGIALAAHGYGHGTVVLAGGAGLPAADSAPRPGASAPAAASTTTAPGSSTTVGPSGPSSKASPTTAAPKLGPLLSSTQYAQYAYQVYPGPESSRTRLATAGFNISVTRHGGTISLSISASNSGQGAQTATYPSSDKVYFIEATLGDDSGSSDYSFGDDGVVVTNAQGYLVQ